MTIQLDQLSASSGSQLDVGVKGFEQLPPHLGYRQFPRWIKSSSWCGWGEVASGGLRMPFCIHCHLGDATVVGQKQV